jgi:hypothetical protein
MAHNGAAEIATINPTFQTNLVVSTNDKSNQNIHHSVQLQIRYEREREKRSVPKYSGKKAIETT